MKASVIICTYNRASYLNKSIKSIQIQDFPADQFEIVVVDNNSTDNTRNVVDGLTSLSHVPIRYIFESRQGLSCARNAGVYNSSGEIITFIDDDAEASPLWLKNLVSAFEDPKVYCVGGDVKGFWSKPKPDWLPDWAFDYLSIKDFSALSKSRKFSYPNYPIGTNIGFRRRAFSEFGKFSENLGRIAGSLLSNEEIELCSRIEKDGKILAYIPNAIVHHLVSDERLEKDWFYNRLYFQGRSEAILDISVNKDISCRLKQYAENIFNYHASSEHDFSDECRYREALGYIEHIVNAASLSDSPEEKFMSLKKITESLYQRHQYILERRTHKMKSFLQRLASLIKNRTGLICKEW